jgi:hypothetical protein
MINDAGNGNSFDLPNAIRLAYANTGKGASVH